MARYLGITARASEALPHITSVPPGTAMAEAGRVVMSAAWPRLLPELARGDLALLHHMAVLAYVSRGRVSAHLVRPAAARLVHETDLHSIPDEAPPMLRGAWIAEVRRPETGERLWGDTFALAGYPMEGGRVSLMGLRWSATADRIAGLWSPGWSGEDVPPPGPVLTDPHSDLDDVERWTAEAGRFATVLALLLISEAAPVRVSEESVKEQRQRLPRGVKGDGVSVRHIYLDQRRAAAQAGAETPQGDEVDREGLDMRTTWVRGHIRRQRYGERWRETKWIYVAGHSSRRWMAPGVRPVTLEARGD